MKCNGKKLLLILAIVMSFTTAQSVSAETIEVDGTITEISTQPNVVVVDGTEVYGVKFNYLDKNHGIVLSVNLDVSFKVYEYECGDGTIKYKACEISVIDNEWIPLRSCP